MREKGNDFSIARTRYTVNKQKFLQHPMVKRISALAEDEQRKGCRPGNEGKAPPGPAHLMQKRALIAMQYSALHHRTWKTPTVQKTCRNRATMAYKTKKSHEIFRFTASTVDIPTRWNPRAKQQQRVALADCLRRYAPPPCSSPFHRANMKKQPPTTQNRAIGGCFIFDQALATPVSRAAFATAFATASATRGSNAPGMMFSSLRSASVMRSAMA